MRIRKSTLTLALSGILALGQLAFLPAANAGNGSKSFAPAEESEATFKRIKTPTDAPLNAPMASWLPPAGVKPRIAMLCIHGFSMHKGCYAAFGKEMAKNGIATYAIDMRGFGERKEIGGKVELDFDGSLVDIKASLEQIQKAHPGLPRCRACRKTESSRTAYRRTIARRSVTGLSSTEVERFFAATTKWSSKPATQFASI